MILIFCITSFSLEIDINGSFRTRTLNQSQYIQDGIEDEWIDSRARVFLNFSKDESLRFVLAFEIGDLRWGNTDAGMPRDGHNVQTKHIFLEWNPNQNSSIRIGLQDIYDSFYSSVFDEDAPGITYSYNTERSHLKAGYIYLKDKNVDRSEEDFHFAFIDNIYKISDSTRIKNLLYFSYFNDPKNYTDRSFYIGAGIEHTMRDLDFGSHIIFQNTKYDNFEYDKLRGYFLYAYCKYNFFDDSYLKLNFGYVPGDDDFSDSKTRGFYGIDDEDFLLVYDLEYSFLGRVNISHNRYGLTSYGFPNEGFMVMSAFYRHGPVFAAIGNLRATSRALSDLNIDKNLGIELNIGSIFNIMDGLRLHAVGALFIPGKYFSDRNYERKNGWMITSNLTYAF